MFHYDWGHMWLGWFFWLVFFGAIIWFILARINKNRSSSYNQEIKETAMDILKKRYARGELTRQEFEQMKKDIET